MVLKKLEHVMDNVVAPDPSSESFSDEVVVWRKGWETKLNTLENVIQHLPKFSENEKAYLADGLIDVEFLANYNASERMDEIDKLLSYRNTNSGGEIKFPISMLSKRLGHYLQVSINLQPGSHLASLYSLTYVLFWQDYSFSGFRRRKYQRVSLIIVIIILRYLHTPASSA